MEEFNLFMKLYRNFKKMHISELEDLMKKECLGKGDIAQYFKFLEELKLKQLECISEGEIFRISRIAKVLVDDFEAYYKKNQNFCSIEERKEFIDLAQEIIR